MWLVLRFSCARGGDEPGLDLAWGWRREERRMSRLSQASLFGFSPSRDLPTFSRRVPSSSLSRRITAFISSLSGYFILLPRGRSLRLRGAPIRGYILSSRNNKLTLLNLSWAAFRSSSLRQQRAPAYLPTNIVTAFNSVISTLCCTRSNYLMASARICVCVCMCVYILLSLPLPPLSRLLK